MLILVSAVLRAAPIVQVVVYIYIYMYIYVYTVHVAPAIGSSVLLRSTSGLFLPAPETHVSLTRPEHAPRACHVPKCSKSHICSLSVEALDALAIGMAKDLTKQMPCPRALTKSISL